MTQNQALLCTPRGGSGCTGRAWERPHKTSWFCAPGFKLWCPPGCFARRPRAHKGAPPPWMFAPAPTFALSRPQKVRPGGRGFHAAASAAPGPAARWRRPGRSAARWAGVVLSAVCPPPSPGVGPPWRAPPPAAVKGGRHWCGGSRPPGSALLGLGFRPCFGGGGSCAACGPRPFIGQLDLASVERMRYNVVS